MLHPQRVKSLAADVENLALVPIQRRSFGATHHLVVPGTAMAFVQRFDDCYAGNAVVWYTQARGAEAESMLAWPVRREAWVGEAAGGVPT